MSFSSYYGNLLDRQEKTNALVTAYIVHDMNELEKEQNKKISTISFIGHSPKSRELLLAGKKRPLFDELVPIYMDNDWFWGGPYLSHYRKSAVSLKSDKADKDYVNSSIPVQRNEFYQLYLRDGKLIILFQNN